MRHIVQFHYFENLEKMDSNLQLEKLFRACDRQGTGHIGPQEFRELCVGFDIDAVDSDAIFTDLDHDGDGQVSLEDFAWGFRDFLSPGSRRASMQIMQDKDLERLEELERRHSQARLAWSHLVAGVGMDSVHKFLNNSGKKLAELYEELQATDTASHLVTHFEGALSSLLQDVKKLHEDNKKMEDMFTREKETHLAHLRDLEEELDAQVARVEAQAREEAQAKFEAEKRRLEERMETEIAELQAHLRMFQKLNTMLSRNQSEKQGVVPNTSQETTLENRELRNTLADTQTNLALLRSEMAQLRANYEAKCQELNCQQETMLTYLHQNDHMYQQLELLHEANTKLQDTNDSLLTVMDVSGLRSPRPSSPCGCSHASSTGSGVGHSEARKHIRNSHPPSRSPSDAESLVDSAPVCLGSARPDIQFGIRRLMEDLDSGRSTMRDVTDVESDKSLQEELQRTTSGHSAGSDSDGDIKQQQLDELSNGMADFSNTKGSCLGRRLIPVGNSIQVPSDTITTELEPIGAPDRTFKIVFAGDAAVGKSCFIFRFCKGVFISNLGSTLGVDFQVKTIRVDERNVTLQLWDTAGQERFRSMTRTYFRRADGVMLLYDVTSERSFLNVRQWVQSIDEVSEHRMPIVLCGNKVDLRPEAQKKGITCVTMMDGELLARDCRAIFLETSSKTGTNILDAILALSRDMLTREDVEVQTSSLCTLHEDLKEGSACCVKKN